MGEVAEWLKALVLKTNIRFTPYRGFESHPHREQHFLSRDCLSQGDCATERHRTDNLARGRKNRYTQEDFSYTKNMNLPFEHVEGSPKTARELLEEFEERGHLPMGELLTFEGVGGKDIYNITAPFTIDGKTYIAGRVESRDTELDSQVRFFEEGDGVWTPALDTPTFDLQDPFVTRIERELVLGGVEISGIEKYPEKLDYRMEFFRGEHLRASTKELDYRTEFFRGEHLQTLVKFAEGPPQMKDIRLIQLRSGEIAVFTRPQGAIGGRGKIGFIKLPNLEALATTDLLGARLIGEQFRDDEWGGANELHLLEDGRIGVLGHSAYSDAGGKHYYPIAFTFDPETEIASPLVILAARKDFPPGPAKRSPELDDIALPGGLIRHQDGTATLYVNLSDASAGRITIPDPFLQQ